MQKAFFTFYEFQQSAKAAAFFHMSEKIKPGSAKQSEKGKQPNRLNAGLAGWPE